MPPTTERTTGAVLPIVFNMHMMCIFKGLNHPLHPSDRVDWLEPGNRPAMNPNTQPLETRHDDP
ncbi:MAG: hypothetical protein JM57_00595 [Comamonadaceae bacterium BICA1-1]|nr:MAG: hypothetical protein JM57_00595 [Comamonadaceae bacterium BICA1-1]